MRKISFIFILFISINISNMAFSTSQQTILWDKTPITVTLPIGKERLIHFGESIAFNSPQPNSALSQDKINVLNNAGTLYLTALQSFDPIRITVTLKETNQVLLLDISVNNEADNHPLNIITAVTESNHQSTDFQQHPNKNYAELTRFAFQQLYAPNRLLPSDAGYFRVPMKTTRTVPSLLSGLNVTSMPLVSWQTQYRYITAIQVRNRSQAKIAVDLAKLCGNWLSASSYPRHVLQPEGEISDSTTLVVISAQPFNESLRYCYGR